MDLKNTNKNLFSLRSICLLLSLLILFPICFVWHYFGWS